MSDTQRLLQFNGVLSNRYQQCKLCQKSGYVEMEELEIQENVEQYRKKIKKKQKTPVLVRVHSDSTVHS